MTIEKFEKFYQSIQSSHELKRLGQHYLIKRDALEWTAKHLGIDDIDYYEFGVFKGKTFRYAQELFSEGSNFYGYDTFEGLPEEWICHIPWRDDLPKEPFRPNEKQSHNNFDLKGVAPDAGRGIFYKGLFQETIANSLKSHSHENKKVILIDCDLYSSTIVILSQLHSYLKTGDIIIFDEFGDLLNEYKAFEDYKSWFRREDSFQCIFRDDEQRLVFGFEVK